MTPNEQLRKPQRTSRVTGAFTLLELLIVLALMAVILLGMSSMIQLFSRQYQSNERRVGRAQLARSISQMLSDDLSVAIQDPIAQLDSDPTRQFARHFGLRGDSRSLQIDVVQPNAFAVMATTSENQRVMAGGDKSPNSRQAPELKTIFYEFVPINAVEGEQDDSEETDDLKAFGIVGADPYGSQLSGTLQSSGVSGLNGVDQSVMPLSDIFWDGFSPLAQKYGLARRELDYETPEEDSLEPSENDLLDPFASAGFTEDGYNSQLAGSLTAPPDAGNSTFTQGVAQTLEEQEQAQDALLKIPMTAVQIAMDSDDGASWAPETLDCRFSYFDGENWLDSWDSIEKNGLPIAIKVELKLTQLDDVDKFRNSPYLRYLPKVPSLAEIAKLDQDDQDVLDSGVDVSRLAGSLDLDTNQRSEPVDVFNSYRPLTAWALALRGISSGTNANIIPAMTSSDDPFNETNEDSQENGAVVSGLSGALGDVNGAGAGMSGGALGAQQGSGVDMSNIGVNAYEHELAKMNAGAIYNDAGICIDFANDGSYMTLEQIASEIGVTQPSVYEVVVYLPTTPFARAKTVERRIPAAVAPGRVATRGQSNPNSARERRAQGANPYATGATRTPNQRRSNERVANERQSRERNARERDANSRVGVERQSAQRNEPAQRDANQRGVNERVGRERAPTAQRAPRERFPGARQDPAATPNVNGNETGTVAATPEAPTVPVATPGVQSAVSGGIGGSGLTSTGEANAFPGLVASIEQTAPADVVPFADNTQVSTAPENVAGLQQGFVSDPNATRQTTVTPNPTVNQTAPRQQQTWIRGKK
ncbi:MAG: hypothetical protein Q4G03_02555 [Planctomycetia bacterium]|nr:hypothetical protein [Planctomycetia bacterium]